SIAAGRRKLLHHRWAAERRLRRAARHERHARAAVVRSGQLLGNRILLGLCACLLDLTGGAGGLGRAVARHLCLRHAFAVAISAADRSSGCRRRLEEYLMTLSVDLFFSFRSPYSYLALPKTAAIVADYDVAVNLRPVYPLAVREPGFFKKTNPLF